MRDLRKENNNGRANEGGDQEALCALVALFDAVGLAEKSAASSRCVKPTLRSF
jgi:hypothetical protein